MSCSTGSNRRGRSTAGHAALQSVIDERAVTIDAQFRSRSSVELPASSQAGPNPRKPCEAGPHPRKAGGRGEAPTSGRYLFGYGEQATNGAPVATCSAMPDKRLPERLALVLRGDDDSRPAGRDHRHVAVHGALGRGAVGLEIEAA